MSASQTLLDALTPYTVDGLQMQHWGPDGDGGYVVPSELLGNATVLVTGGVSDDVRFEAEVAAKNPGIRIGLFDHTISKPPTHTPPNAVWHKLGLGPAPGCISLEAAVEMCGARPKDDLVVKLDIEFAEWDVLESTPMDFWNRVSVLIIEMHGLDDEAQWGRYATLLGKLNRHLLIVHLHGNNYDWTVHFRKEGVQVPISIEATYINRKWIVGGKLPHTWDHAAPTPLDRRNNCEVIEIPFDFWLKKSPLRRLITNIGLYLLPWRIKKNFCQNLIPKPLWRRIVNYLDNP